MNDQEMYDFYANPDNVKIKGPAGRRLEWWRWCGDEWHRECRPPATFTSLYWVQHRGRPTWDGPKITVGS